MLTIWNFNIFSPVYFIIFVNVLLEHLTIAYLLCVTAVCLLCVNSDTLLCIYCPYVTAVLLQCYCCITAILKKNETVSCVSLMSWIVQRPNPRMSWSAPGSNFALPHVPCYEYLRLISRSQSRRTITRAVCFRSKGRKKLKRKLKLPFFF